MYADRGEVVGGRGWGGGVTDKSVCKLATHEAYARLIMTHKQRIRLEFSTL